jgi:hypothetical protein
MENPRATVLKLIAFVNDPAANVNEARSMAVKACRLIEKHELIDPPPPEAETVSQEEEAPTKAKSFEDFLADMVEKAAHRRAREARVREAKRPRPPRPPTYPAGTEPWDVDVEQPAAPPPQPTVPGTRRVAPDSDARLITVLEPAYCPGCAEKLVYGRYGMWSRGEVWHTSCFEVATR